MDNQEKLRFWNELASNLALSIKRVWAERGRCLDKPIKVGEPVYMVVVDQTMALRVEGSEYRLFPFREVRDGKVAMFDWHKATWLAAEVTRQLGPESKPAGVEHYMDALWACQKSLEATLEETKKHLAECEELVK